MIDSLKSRIGFLLAGGYILLFLLALIDIVISKPDAMSALGLMFLAMPWSFWLLEAIPAGSFEGFPPVTFFVLLGLCAIVNAVVLYCLGLLISFFINFVKK